MNNQLLEMEEAMDASASFLKAEEMVRVAKVVHALCDADLEHYFTELNEMKMKEDDQYMPLYHAIKAELMIRLDID